VSTSIRPLDPESERDISDVTALLTSYWREVLGPDEPEVAPAEIRTSLRLDRDDIDHTVLLAVDGARTVGYASVEIHSGHGNEHMAYVEDFYVLPASRRQGTGRALLAEVRAIAGAAGRSLLLGGFDEGNLDAEGFVKTVGAALGNRDRQNRVRVAALDRSLLESWVAVAPTGYSIVAFDDVCPDDLVDGVVALANVMNDAPRSEKLDETRFTAEFHRAAEAERTKAGIRYWYVAARHDATGELAGFTELGVRHDKPWFVEQGDTGVAPPHRGHAIGRWVKAVNALRVLDELPDARVIETWNDGTNKWMLAINDAMGFRPVATWIETELEL
jgi:mycothiol synthase